MDNFGWSIALVPGTPLIIGDTPDAHIQLQGAYGRAARIALQMDKSMMYSILSKYSGDYDTCVNDKIIQKSAKINNHDFISIGDFMAYYNRGKIYFDYGVIKTNGVDVRPESMSIQTTYPVFIRNTRIQVKMDETPIDILEPGTVPKKPELNLITTLFPPVFMMAMMMLLKGTMSGSSSSFMMFSVCSMGVGVLTSIFGIVNREKQYKKTCIERQDTYKLYIEKKRKEIENIRREELDCLNDQYYSTVQDISHIENFDTTLFDRIPTDHDFLEVYLGRGNVESLRQINYKKQEKLEVGDELSSIPNHVADEYRDIEKAPLTLSLRDANAVGIVGNEESLYCMMKNIIVDIISRQYYGDINLYALIDKDEKKYKWLKNLKSIQGTRGCRNIVCDQESRNRVFDNLYKELTLRQDENTSGRFNIVVVMEDYGIKSHPISKFIEHASELDTVFLFFESKLSLLPLYCSHIIDIFDYESAMVYDSQNKMHKKYFEYESIDDESMENIVRILAPVECEEISLAGALRKNISLFELLGVNSVEGLNLDSRWENSKIYEAMAVPLGVNVKDEIVYLNLHEKFHGPHGLVAGTTGSGKSEILQTFILGAATLFHPYEIGFLIIDFKGGGMVNQFKDLPHLIGAITNIDGNEVQRSLKSIKAELMKRQNYFAEAGVNHIDKYIQLYKEHKVSEPLPHLVIIVDEFAELKAEQPEFMKELISTARIGRSLGVHLILATQKPSGVVDGQIWSNSKFKLCLKVQSKEDSNEVLKTPLAAEIKEPGRAYLQVGNNEIFELLQSAYSGAAAVSEGEEEDKEFSIYELDFSGKRSLVYQNKKKKQKSKTQLEAVVDYIKDFCEQTGIERLPSICMPPLPETIAYEQSEKKSGSEIWVNIGIVDEPERQLQKKLELNLSTQNYMIIGSAQSGKTNLLQTIIRGVAENYTPQEVNLYIIDFGSMILRNYANLNHCGGVVCSDDDEKLKNLFKLLNKEINLRKEKLAEIGVSSFLAYKEAGKTDLPQIIVLIDNMTALKEMYLQDIDYLLPLFRDGIAVGMTFVVANLQTSGIGQRYLSNFEGRITLFCNDSSEYSMMLNGVRLSIPNTPGRCMVQLDKEVLEAQLFISFEGEKEYERVQKIKSFVDEQNDKYINQKAKVIPEIPKELTLTYIQSQFTESISDDKVIIGLDYTSILPVAVELKSGDVLSLTGKNQTDRETFAKYFMDTIVQKASGNTELYVLDDATKKMGECEFNPNTAMYLTSYHDVPPMIEEINQRIEQRYEMYSAGMFDELEMEPWIILVIDSADIMLNMSGDNKIMKYMKEWLGKYKNMKIFVFMPDIENNSISFNSPEMLKIVKDNRHYMVFDDVCNIKICDISVSASKKYSKPIETGDAYYIKDNELVKIKVVRQS